MARHGLTDLLSAEKPKAAAASAAEGATISQKPDTAASRLRTAGLDGRCVCYIMPEISMQRAPFGLDGMHGDRCRAVAWKTKAV